MLATQLIPEIQRIQTAKTAAGIRATQQTEARILQTATTKTKCKSGHLVSALSDTRYFLTGKILPAYLQELSNKL